jgi:hypothetical protein
MIITLGFVGHFKLQWRAGRHLFFFGYYKHLVHMIFTQILVILVARAHARSKTIYL